MKLSKRTRYGFRLMVELALNFEKGPLSIREISTSQGISEKYLEQIIIQLKTMGPVTAVRGPKGGYMLSMPPSRITLKSLFDILEGSDGIIECVQNTSVCKRVGNCISRKIWVALDENIRATLNSTTLEDLITGGPRDLNTVRSGIRKPTKSINKRLKQIS
jgi:Rrf2 family transcriptional regulator, cysteine metabolism repressor